MQQLGEHLTENFLKIRCLEITSESNFGHKSLTKKISIVVACPHCKVVDKDCRCNVTLVSYIYGMLIPTAYILLGDLTFNGKLCRFLFTIDDHMEGEKSTDSMFKLSLHVS